MEKWDIIFWIFVSITLLLLIWLLFGQSPAAEALIAALIGSEVALWRTMYKHGRELALISKDISSINELLKGIKTK